QRKPNKKNPAIFEKEIDLHIEELLEDFNGMSNGEILNYQIKIFQKELDKAISSKMKKIIFIHGVGNGRLKSEIRHILKSFPELKFCDGSYKKYGYGATEVILH
ncbi:MAG: Smr/MutS family protein, partial [Bacteroidota bacterium]